jgi:hypothetical protein
LQGFPLGAEELATGAYKGLEGLGASEHDELCGSGGSKVRDAGVVGVYAGQAQSPVTEGGSALYIIHYIIIIKIVIHNNNNNNNNNNSQQHSKIPHRHDRHHPCRHHPYTG